MNRVIKDLSDLESIVNKAIEKSMKLTQKEIFQIMKRKVAEYYKEEVFRTGTNKPSVYNRTNKLKDSLECSPINAVNGTYVCQVGWTDEYIEFTYPKIGKYGTSNTGGDVLRAFNSSYHGATDDYRVKGNHDYWDEIIDEINSIGGVIGIFKKNLKKFL